jgi:hypothetical protein
MNLFVQDLKKLEEPAKQVTFSKDRSVSGGLWKGKDVILFSKDNNGDENYHIYKVNLKTNETVDLTPFEGTRCSILDSLEDDDKHVLIRMNKRDKKVFDVYRMDVRTGEIVLIAENPGNYVGWGTDHEGKLRIAMAAEGTETIFLYRDDENKPFKEQFRYGYRDSFYPMLFTFDNKKMYCASNIGRDKVALVMYNPETAKEEAVLYMHAEVDILDIAYSKKRKWPLRQ